MMRVDITNYNDHEFEDGRYILFENGDILDTRRDKMVKIKKYKNYINTTLISRDGRQVSVKVLKLLNNEFNNKNFSRHVIKDENLPLHYSNIKPARREYVENEEIMRYIKDNGLKMSLNGLSNEIFDLFSVRIYTNELKKVVEELHSNDTDIKPLSDIYKEHQMNLKKKVKKRVEMMLKHKMLIKKVIIREQFSKVALKPQLLMPVINEVFKEYSRRIEENNKEVMKK